MTISCQGSPGCQRFPVASFLQLLEMIAFAIGKRIGELRTSPDRYPAAVSYNLELECRVRILEASLQLLQARLARVLNRQGSQYLPHERWQILRLRAEAGLSQKAAAARFLLAETTIARWEREARKDLEREQIGSLLKSVPPVTRFCDAFRALVQHLASLGLAGSGQIAAFLCHASLKVSRSTVRRILHEPPHRPDPSPKEASKPEPKHIKAREPLHVVMADITELPSAFGLPSFKLAAFYDVFSRAPLVWGLFRKQPSGRDVTKLFHRLCRTFWTPKHLISDQGACFKSGSLKKALRRKGVKHRFGAVGQHGSIALIERFWKTVKTSLRLPFVPPIVEGDVAPRIDSALAWYTFFRPHSALGGRTPGEILFELPAPKQKALPPPRGQPGAAFPPLNVEVFTLDHDGRFPVVLKKAA